MRSARAGLVALYLVVSTLALLWPAFYNGYPLVFGDTGVYLLDGVTIHVSWPRPFFYGLAMVPLHLTLTAWPVVVAQAATAAALIRLTIAMFLPRAGEAFAYVVMAVLAIATSLPWFAAQIMPDVFGPLVILAIAPVLLMPERLRPWQQILLILLAAGFTTFHQSFVPVLGAAVVLLLLLRWWLRLRVRWVDVARAGVAPVLVIGAFVAANAVFLGEPSFSPYGKIFPLARMIVEGPGQRTLERECPKPGWTLCAQIGHFPGNVEDFQFGDDGTINRAGGFRVVGTQAGPIIADTFKAEPGTLIAAVIRRSLQQFVSFATGDWLLRPKPQVRDAWARVFPPAEVARYDAARQQRFLPLVADALQALHQTIGFLGLAVLFTAAVVEMRRRSTLGALLLVFAATLVVNAIIAGGVSGVYDRYQSRFVWLAVFGSLMWLATLRQPARRPAPVADAASA